MNDINEIIIPNIPALSFSINYLDVQKSKATLRGRHFHKEFEIFRIDEGVMQLCTNDNKIELYAGDIVFINSFYVHEIKASSENCKATYLQIDLQPYINSFLGIDDNFLYHYINTQHSEKYKVFAAENINDIITQIITELNDRSDYYDMQIKAYIYQLIVYMFRYDFITNHNKLNFKSKEKILPAINYINNNLDKKISLDELCVILHLDKYYFCKLFKKIIGTTFTEYLNYARLYKAELLLLNSKKSISDIAFECGFSSTQYFNKIFKKQHGFSPLNYKKLFTK